ncbi:MAG: hypothetical protein ACHREM_13660 [Polyangiales bacterium]
MTTVDDDLEDIFLQPRHTARPRPRAMPGFDPPRWPDPLQERLEAFLDAGKSRDPAIVHFPAALEVTRVQVRGDDVSVVLLGFAAVCRPTWLSHARLPRVLGHDAYGGVVELDARDLLDLPDRWAVGGDGHRAWLLDYHYCDDGVQTTFAVALVATEGMKIRRHVVDRGGNVRLGSEEEWTVEGSTGRIAP